MQTWRAADDSVWEAWITPSEWRRRRRKKEQAVMWWWDVSAISTLSVAGFVLLKTDERSSLNNNNPMELRVSQIPQKIFAYPRIFCGEFFAYFNGTDSVYVCVCNNEARGPTLRCGPGLHYFVDLRIFFTVHRPTQSLLVSPVCALFTVTPTYKRHWSFSTLHWTFRLQISVQSGECV